jgi:hypothetical protein
VSRSICGLAGKAGLGAPRKDANTLRSSALSKVYKLSLEFSSALKPTRRHREASLDAVPRVARRLNSASEIEHGTDHDHGAQQK